MKNKMVPNNIQIAELLRDVAAAYQLENEAKNKFRIVAYQRAADAVEHLSSELKDIWDEGKLDDVPGIGSSISEHLNELFSKGYSSHFDSLMEALPPAMFDLMKVSGIGPKTAFKIASELKVSKKDPYGDLEKLAKNGEIAKLSGMGEESQADILRSLSELKGRSIRTLLPHAEHVATEVINWLMKCSDVIEANPLGSLRRRASTVGDIDIAVASKNASSVLNHFVEYPGKTRMIEKGTHSSSIVVPGDLQVDVMVIDPSQYGSLLQHFTGSKHHNIALREYALKKGLSLSEYGIRPTPKKEEPRIKPFEDTKNLKKFATEADFYHFLGMEWVPPELREGNEEIERAINDLEHKKGGLPKLIEVSDIRADLQMHTDYDIETSHDLGESSMKAHVDRANELKYEYIAFTEHNPSQKGHTATQITSILKRKQEAVQKLNVEYVKKQKGSMVKVFNSLEIDILPTGKIPVDDSGMDTLDFALVSIHSSFKLSKSDMTKRVLSAFSHPKVKIFAHPTGRKINYRESVELDWDEIFEFALKNNKWIEINADPSRLDLPDFLVKEAVDKGVLLTMGTDAHHVDGMSNMPYAVSVARRGWCEPVNVVNTYSFIDFEKMLK
jgi:DNA polymerase (family X)